MTRKDYAVVAKAVNKMGEWMYSYDLRAVATSLADAFEKEYSNFDRDKFLKACYE